MQTQSCGRGYVCEIIKRSKEDITPERSEEIIKQSILLSERSEEIIKQVNLSERSKEIIKQVNVYSMDNTTQSEFIPL